MRVRGVPRDPGADDPGRCVMRLIPRAASKLYADMFGYFWVPCPVCGAAFGGHEWRSVNGHLESIPMTHTLTMTTSKGICPTCTAAGVGCRAQAKVGRYHHGCLFSIPPWLTSEDVP